MAIEEMVRMVSSLLLQGLHSFLFAADDTGLIVAPG